MSKKSKALSGLSVQELTSKVFDLRKDLIKLKAQAKTTGMKNSTSIRETKRAIARALTFANTKGAKEEAQTKSSSKTKKAQKVSEE